MPACIRPTKVSPPCPFTMNSTSAPSTCCSSHSMYTVESFPVLFAAVKLVPASFVSSPREEEEGAAHHGGHWGRMASTFVHQKQWNIFASYPSTPMMCHPPVSPVYFPPCTVPSRLPPYMLTVACKFPRRPCRFASLRLGQDKLPGPRLHDTPDQGHLQMADPGLGSCWQHLQLVRDKGPDVHRARPSQHISRH